MEVKPDTEEDFHSADSGSDSDSYRENSPDARGPNTTKSSPVAPALAPKKRQVSSTKLDASNLSTLAFVGLIYPILHDWPAHNYPSASCSRVTLASSKDLI